MYNLSYFSNIQWYRLRANIKSCNVTAEINYLKNWEVNTENVCDRENSPEQ